MAGYIRSCKGKLGLLCGEHFFKGMGEEDIMLRWIIVVLEDGINLCVK